MPHSAPPTAAAGSTAGSVNGLGRTRNPRSPACLRATTPGAVLGTGAAVAAALAPALERASPLLLPAATALLTALLFAAAAAAAAAPPTAFVSATAFPFDVSTCTQVAIVLTGRRAKVLEETAQEIRKAHGEGVHVLVHAAYLTLAADVKGLFNAVASNFGRLDLLFNNLGANVPPSTFDKMDFVLSTMPLSPVELRIVKERLDPQPHKVRSCQITMTSWMRGTCNMEAWFHAPNACRKTLLPKSGFHMNEAADRCWAENKIAPYPAPHERSRARRADT